jgi:putative membrane protein
MMWFGYGPGWGWMALGWIMMMVFWALVIVGVVALVKYASIRSLPRVAGSADSPLEILRRRYATGQLTKEQFEEMKRDVA